MRTLITAMFLLLVGFGATTAQTQKPVVEVYKSPT